jgi:hypothetical protein
MELLDDASGKGRRLAGGMAYSRLLVEALSGRLLRRVQALLHQWPTMLTSRLQVYRGAKNAVG